MGIDAASSPAQTSEPDGRFVRLPAIPAKLLEAALRGSLAGLRTAEVPGSARPRSRNATNLVDALRSVLSREALSVSEAAKRVIEAGYRSNSPSFRQIVNQTLAKSEQFERVGRGLYKAK